MDIDSINRLEAMLLRFNGALILVIGFAVPIKFWFVTAGCPAVY